MEYVLQTSRLSKRYKNQWAVKEVDMHISKGDIYGFVGENGSGKTTIIRLITGLISPTEGSFSLFGVSNTSKDILKARQKVGAIVESPSIYMNMSALDNLKMQCGIAGIRENIEEKCKAVLEEVGLLEQYGDKKHASNYSLGMRQRLGLAMALIGNPEFIILDEPMNGLDPAGIVGIRELILKLNRERDITFLISSHILTELALVATKYGIISKGRLVKEITAEDLKKECRPILSLTTSHREKLMQVLGEYFAQEDISQTPSGVKVVGDVRLNDLFKRIIDEGIEICSVTSYDSSIEDYYLSLIGGARRV